MNSSGTEPLAGTPAPGDGPPAAPSPARQALRDHARAKGEEIRRRYGPAIGWEQVEALLADRACARYPCALVFDAQPLEPGELAFPLAKGSEPADGFTFYLHPYFASRRDLAAYAVLYALVRVNYGELGGREEAEALGAAALGLTEDQYYQQLCELADAAAQAWAALVDEGGDPPRPARPAL